MNLRRPPNCVKLRSDSVAVVKLLSHSHRRGDPFPESETRLYAHSTQPLFNTLSKHVTMLYWDVGKESFYAFCCMVCSMVEKLKLAKYCA